MRKSAELLSRLHGVIAEHIQVGVTTSFLDEVAREFLQQEGVVSSFKGYEGYPAHICVSVNQEVAHGLPNSYRVQLGDIISVDAAVFCDGYHSDSAFTYSVGKIDQPLLDLLSVTEASLKAGIQACRVGNRLGDIGFAIQKCVEAGGFQIIKDYCGHGIGKYLHELPNVANYGSPGRGGLIREGMVLAIEPMVSMVSDKISEFLIPQSNINVVVTQDGLPAAHFEHTVAVVNGQAEMLTSYEYIRNTLTNNYVTKSC